MKVFTQVLTIASLVFSCAVSQAETISIPVGQQASTVDKPSLGYSMQQVKANYGEPLKISGPTGEPPITRWDYASFSVYFESDTVIHSVSKHRPQQSEQDSKS
jgi:hypothetical protein